MFLKKKYYLEGTFRIVKEIENGLPVNVIKHNNHNFGKTVSIQAAVSRLQKEGLKKIESIIKNPC